MIETKSFELTAFFDFTDDKHKTNKEEAVENQQNGQTFGYYCKNLS